MRNTGIVVVIVVIAVIVVIFGTVSALTATSEAFGLKSEDTYLGMSQLPSGRYLLYGRPNQSFGAEKTFGAISLSRKRFRDQRRHITLDSKNNTDTPHNAAHNLCALSLADSRRIGESLYAVGGEFRKNHKTMTGIHLLQFDENHDRPRWVHAAKLVDGLHPSCTELRPSFNGVCEFDGLSCLVWFKGMWRLFCRANAGSSGHRALQVCSGSTLADFAPFDRVRIKGHEDVDDVYFMHAYALPDQSTLLGIVPVSFTSRPGNGGIYATTSTDGVNFGPLSLLRACKVENKRTADLPIAGIVWRGPQRFEYAVHRNVPGRVSGQAPQFVSWHTANVP